MSKLTSKMALILLTTVRLAICAMNFYWGLCITVRGIVTIVPINVLLQHLLKIFLGISAPCLIHCLTEISLKFGYFGYPVVPGFRRFPKMYTIFIQVRSYVFVIKYSYPSGVVGRGPQISVAVVYPGICLADTRMCANGCICGIENDLQLMMGRPFFIFLAVRQRKSSYLVRIWAVYSQVL